MLKSIAARTRSLFITLKYFTPSYLLLALAGLTTHPLSLVLLLGANALAMTAVCHVIGFSMESSFARSIARRGLVYFVLLTGYSALVILLLAVPVWWLLHTGSLSATLALSATFVVALLALWRFWPAFALPFVWDDAYPHDEHGSWLLATLRRSLSFAYHLTGENELFFSHGLPASLFILILTTGALSLAGLYDVLPSEFRITALVGYGVLIMPLTHLLAANRCVRALLTEARHVHERNTLPIEDEMPPSGAIPSIPVGVSQIELNATLLCAARSGQIDLALTALERGADPNTLPTPQNHDQRSVLTLAVTLSDLRLLRSLIAKGANVNRAQEGLTPLMTATRDSYQGRPDAVMTLLANGADPSVKDAQGNTPLHYAVRCIEPIVAALLLDANAEINAINQEGLTPLGIACANGPNSRWTMTSFLLDHQAKIEVERAQPALLLAAGLQDDDPTGIKLLLKHKAKVDARGALERTALMTAALAGHTRIAEALLVAGALPDLVDRHGTTALMEAARFGAVAVIHALAKRKAKPELLDASGRNALIIACQSRHASEESVCALLALGADREFIGADGKRALDHAAAAGRWHIVALLDPTYPVPSNLSANPLSTQAPDAEYLLDALRFEHWHIVEEFTSVIRTWPPAELALLYLALVEPEQTQARIWLLNNGLPADVKLTDNTSLLDALLNESCVADRALRDLVAHGASVGGAGVIARLLGSALHSENHKAVCSLAKDWLERGADWYGCLANGASSLHLAVGLGDVELVTLLLERGHDPNLRDSTGNTPLSIALKPDVGLALLLLQVLIAHGANPEMTAANGETPLGLALARAEHELVYWLNWTHWRLPGRCLRPSDLSAAAALGDFDAISRLLTLGFPVDARDVKGATALIRAAGSGHADLVAYLLEVGANASLAAHSGATCLSAAMNAQHEAVVHILLKYGVNPEQRLPGGGTPLMMAVAKGSPRLAEILLQYGADANATDDQANATLHCAAQFAFNNHDIVAALDLVELLLRHGANLEARNKAGQTPLLLLLGACAAPGTPCDAQHLSLLLTFLIEHNVVVDVQDQRGVSALHACAMHGLLGPTRLLKAQQANRELLDGFGRTAAEVAQLLGFVDVAAELGMVRDSVPSVHQTLRRPART